MGPRVLVIDNYDSFVYNLVQYLGELGAEPLVHRHDALTLDELVELDPDAVLISPGPGHARRCRAVSNDVIHHFAGRRPVLGVCLGHQCIGQVFGGEVVRAAAGDARQDLADPPRRAPACSPACRSRSRRPATTRSSSTGRRCPTCSRSPPRPTTASIMGLRHRELDVEGVQFHPESILTVAGHDLLAQLPGRGRPPVALDRTPRAARRAPPAGCSGRGWSGDDDRSWCVVGSVRRSSIASWWSACGGGASGAVVGAVVVSAVVGRLRGARWPGGRSTADGAGRETVERRRVVAVVGHRDLRSARRRSAVIGSVLRCVGATGAGSVLTTMPAGDVVVVRPARVRDVGEAGGLRAWLSAVDLVHADRRRARDRGRAGADGSVDRRALVDLAVGRSGSGR